MPVARPNSTSAYVVAACILVALVRASVGRVPHPTGAATPDQERELFAEETDAEPFDRQDAARRFRGSPWSQDDDFHAKEMKRVKDFAKTHSVSISSLLDGLDEGMHKKWPTPAARTPNPKVMPCRPRLIY
jgi:hypothetical protein